MTGPGRRLYPPVYFIAALLLMWALDRLLPLAVVVPEPLRALRFVAAGLGILLALAGNLQFLRARTTVHPFRKPAALVTGGVYAVSRNPMYLAMLLILAGAFLHFGTLAPLAVLPLFMAVVTRQVIAVEEGLLEDRFGEEYGRYRSRVRRWI